MCFVQLDPVDEDEQQLGKQRSSLHLRNNSEEEVVVEDAVENNNCVNMDAEKPDVLEQENAVAAVTVDHPTRNYSSRFSSKLTNLEIPRRDELLLTMQSEHLATTTTTKLSVDNLVEDNGYDSASEEGSATEQDELTESQRILVEEDEEEVIPAETILQRINSHKEMKSYQLGKQLSCRWTTGAGPRIGCVRDYPSGLQFRALEQVNLSPRSSCAIMGRSLFSPGCGSSKSSTPIAIVSRSVGHCRVQLSPLCKGGGKRTL